MPLLGLFSKKSKSPLKLSSGIPSTSNVSLGENGWVDINTAASASTSQQQQPRQRQQPSVSSSPFNSSARTSNDECVYDPPTRHSSLFPSLQDDRNTVYGSTHTPSGTDTRSAPNKLSFTPSHLPPPLPSKKSLFSWYSSAKERPHTTTIPSIKSASDSSDASFNLKSFRHVRPESPSFSPTTAPATALPHSPTPQASPALVPVPTSAPPPAPVSFQVTSRKPRPPPPSLLSSDTPATSSYSANTSTSPTSAVIPPQSKVAAGVFRQAARRSATSLTLGEPIVMTGENLEGQGSGGLTLSLPPGDDFKEMASFLSSPPKLPPFSFSFSNPDLSSNSTESVSINSTRPPRPRPPPNLSSSQPSASSVPYTLLNHSSTSVSSPALAPNLSSLSSALHPPSTLALASTKPAPSSKSPSIPPGKRINSSSNLFGNSSSDASDSEEEETESESDESDTGLPRVSRKRTVRPRNNTLNAAATTTTTTSVTPGRSRAATTTAAPPRPNPIGQEISNSQLNLPPSIPLQSISTTSRPLLTNSNNTFPSSASTPHDAATSPALCPPSTLSVYSNGGVRPRASASVGALHPSAKEARASVILANSRLSTATNLSTPKAMSKPLTKNTGSDTSESSESEADSDEEDAPLSKLVPPKRPGTSMSSHSTASNSSLQKKPLIDLSAPSTFSGRPVGAPAPISREEEEMPRPRILGDAKGRSSPILKNTRLNLSANEKVVSPLHPSHLSQQQQSDKKPLKSTLSLSSGSTMSSPSSSGASLTTSSRGVGATSSDTSISPSDRHLRYHSFANGIDPAGGSSGSRSTGSGPSPSRALHPNSPSANLPSVVVPPMRPFVRRDSPTASSTGDSSSGKVPLTPKEEDDIRRSVRPPSALASSKDYTRPTHGRKSSVTFEDDVSFMDNGTRPVHVKTAENDSAAGEAKRRERRRSEARAAIELGKVVNGPPPVDEDEVTLDARAQAAWPQFGMQMPMQPMPMPMPMQSMFAMGGNMGGMTIGPQMQMSFPNPMPNSDPAFLAAHQQAMAIAKQTFQYTVAQQALAAANEEWERGSTMTGYMPVSYMNMNMRGSMMFPPSPASMYAGNTGNGSLINGFGGLGSAAGGAWGGTRSVYGGSFGPATTAPMAMRLSTYSSTDLTAMNTPMMTANANGSPQAQQRPGVRQRTRTAPSSQSPPVPVPPPMPSPAKSAVRTRAPAPPSSFRGVPG
ncbi:hypothetical protein Clacol_007512 [Clathrus columnatus]|uniref:Uncharacterized protein n=1 Tax=Clathrus columnatus TaxID=1419009 RepID=A0AAV5AF40_9AGAM|nr:hypothetical protein Clacol_007512 [Clathrus columnatus]